MGALSFTSPLVLAALIALPAIWLLLRATPPSPKRVRFPAFELLRRLAKTRETPEQTPWWVLLLRLAVAGLAIIGLAGPILNAPPPAESRGPLLIVVDDSWPAAPRWRVRQDAIASAAEQATRAGRETFLLTTADAAAGVRGPMTGAQLADAGAALQPQPHLPNYRAARSHIQRFQPSADAEVRWLSDGLDHQGAVDLFRALARIGSVSVNIDGAAPPVALRPPQRNDAALSYVVARVGDGLWRGDVVALSKSGRELARTKVELQPGEAQASATLDLPLALQNDVAQTRIESAASAGAVQLVDARERRALIGFVAGVEAGADPLLTGAHYIRKALSPFALFVTDEIEALIASDASVIVLDDIGVLRAGDVDALTRWIEEGGVLIRFAGPTLAEAAADRTPPLLPVGLRGGGRAFGGALTWETPQLLGEFSQDGPFADLEPPKDVYVRRQILAEPDGETSLRTWASLSDGTPLVTGRSSGAGAIVLFHVTATPDWSDLPLAATFIDMLRKLTFISALGPKRAEQGQTQTAAPYRVLDGFGTLKAPADDLRPVRHSDLEKGPAPGRPPGFYGAPEAPLALNAVDAETVLRPFAVDGADIRAYVEDPPIRIGPPLFLIALLLLAADGLVALRLAGRLSFATLAVCLVLAAPDVARAAAPLDRSIDQKAMDAALAFRLAYVKSGDPSVDRIAEAGLAGLSRELTRRTSAEPAAPFAVDPETDDLSVYPFLYWPITAGAASLSDRALANIENFMRFGGLIIFDTRDDERAVAGAETPENLALKQLMANLDVPPLTIPPEDHVLKRAFYLLPDLPGRMALQPVWVQAGDGPNDSVTPVIIGGRDWAAAWASDQLGRPLFPMATGGERARELAYRAGINMVMVALTGNYKSDQVHAPILLERLGRR
jgi:hypothetical protein